MSGAATVIVAPNLLLETAVVVSNNRFAATITVAAPLKFAHAVGAQVAGTGITVTAALTHPHASVAQVAGSPSTPGAPNHYYRRLQ